MSVREDLEKALQCVERLAKECDLENVNRTEVSRRLLNAATQFGKDEESNNDCGSDSDSLLLPIRKRERKWPADTAPASALFSVSKYISCAPVRPAVQSEIIMMSFTGTTSPQACVLGCLC